MFQYIWSFLNKYLGLGNSMGFFLTKKENEIEMVLHI